MIQTQLLRLDPPYQIISAGGQVGIQLATLIVTEEKTTETGEYVIDTHSHPVVSYGLKEGLLEAFKYGSNFPEEADYRNNRLQPEGAVWNKVEVSDIHVLGLAGADNRPISMATFFFHCPPVSFIHALLSCVGWEIPHQDVRPSVWFQSCRFAL